MKMNGDDHIGASNPARMAVGSLLSSNVDWFVGHGHFFGWCFSALLLLRIPHEHNARERIDQKYYPWDVDAIAIAANGIEEQYNQLLISFIAMGISWAIPVFRTCRIRVWKILLLIFNCVEEHLQYDKASTCYMNIKLNGKYNNNDNKHLTREMQR